MAVMQLCSKITNRRLLGETAVASRPFEIQLSSLDISVKSTYLGAQSGILKISHSIRKLFNSKVGQC